MQEEKKKTSWVKVVVTIIIVLIVLPMITRRDRELEKQRVLESLLAQKDPTKEDCRIVDDAVECTLKAPPQYIEPIPILEPSKFEPIPTVSSVPETEPVLPSAPAEEVVTEQQVLYETIDEVPGVHEQEHGSIIEVISGDTFSVRLDNLARVNVRLLGIEFPDTGKEEEGFWLNKGINAYRVGFCNDEGIFGLNNAVKGAHFTLYRDENEMEKDEKGNLLRYMVLDDGTILNYALVYWGLAVMRDFGDKECALCSDLYGLEQESAETKDGCLWKSELKYECHGSGC